MNLDKKAVDLSGKEFQGDVKLRDFVATILAEEKSADPLRSYNLALDIKKGEEKLNDSDVSFIKETVKKSEKFIPLIIGQILEELEKKTDKK